MDARDQDVLLTSPLLMAAGADLLASLVRSASVHDYQGGETLFAQGEPADALIVVAEGCVKLCRKTGSHEQAVLSVLTAGQVYFEPSMFSAGRHLATAEAVSFARVIRFDAMALRAAMAVNPGFALDLLALCSDVRAGLVKQIEQLKTHSVSQRVASFLLEQIEAANEGTVITLPFSKTLIAMLVGATSESFSRALVQLRAHGVEVDREKVTILDVERMRRYVGAPFGNSLRERKQAPTRFSSLWKRRKFDEGLLRSWRKAVATSEPISLLLVDVGIDRSPGEVPSGQVDRALLAAVGDDIFHEADRDGKSMVHYNGEIFAVAAPGADHAGAMKLGNKLLSIIKTNAIRLGAATPASGIAAIGTTTIVPNARDRIEKIVCYADIALHRAKALGRGRVCSFHDDPSCQTAKRSHSGGARIPVIKSSHCSECRRDATCA
ncbi:cyclic nucleotide-binding domain-containing protein [Rhodoblastus sp.]|jgi:diguanylate cyclase (GGDEF)-like protein|uniref:cyclic nucleotide-binding domain-containing protein n=1 Tax=Rhodoblastus sp. TaxID=1962975 RepID=UPI0025D99329|nr:cyclic nucleotide-binding domain-containing protein [Rhodoblastus sp.]